MTAFTTGRLMAGPLRLVLCTSIVALLLAAAPRSAAPSPSKSPLASAAAATAPAAVASNAAPSFDEVPLFRLGGTAGLPAYLKASASTLADEAGLGATGDIRTVAS